ncbi:MAG: Ig-like domain-containing protein, partial [Verrucomicrobia subdivision 3 bacterium]|nr:Ig-like domain-containing protein [Limisphaerales bacterium]
GDCVIGGVVYRGQAIPALQGRYLFADFRSGYVRALQRTGTNAAIETLFEATIGLTSFGRDPRDGEVLATHLFDGAILKLVYVAPEAVTNLPPTLAETGIFADLAALTPNPGILGYDINVPFWSDHANKKRWFCVPTTNLAIGFSERGAWEFPIGAVWVKHFDLELIDGNPASARRLETRVLVNSAEGLYGLTYRWGNSRTNAWLVPPEGYDEHFTIRDAGGKVLREQDWRYPSRAECLDCHTKWGGRVLGFNTAQLNRTVTLGAEQTNQLTALGGAGYLVPPPPPESDRLPALVPASDPAAPVEFRVRSYFQANCVACHQPGAHGFTSWDGRYTTPLSDAEIVSPGGVIKPGSIAESRLYHRLLGSFRLMPPIATSVHNTNALNLVANWITNMPPAPWSYQTVGADPVHFGGALFSNGVFHIGGAGLSLQRTNDAFEFTRIPFDYPAAQVIVRLVSQTARGTNAFAGLMLRGGVGDSARFALAAIRGDGAGAMLYRTNVNSSAASAFAAALPTPGWLRLVRSGDDVIAFRSADGSSWVQLGSVNWPISNGLQAGFAVNSGSRTAFNNAVFDNASYLAMTLTSSAPPEMQHPAHVPLLAVVERSGRSLARVDFYDGSQKIHQTTNPPFSIVVSNVSGGTHEFRARAVDEAGAEVASQPIRVLVPSSLELSDAPWQDRVTGGGWSGTYGASGFSMAGHRTNLPAQVGISLAGATTHVWAFETDSPRALAKIGGYGRIAAAWKAASTFTMSIRLPESEFHRVALYFLDWETSNARVQRLDISDPATGDILASHTLSSFSGGVYVSFTARGSLNVRLSALAAPGAVLSGVFIDGSLNVAPQVELLAPRDGDALALPADLGISASASDSDGAIERVEFFLDGKLLGTTGDPPYRYTLSNLLAGTYTAAVRAYDNVGSYSESPTVTFRAMLPKTKAIFLRGDAATRGNWMQRYGSEGFVLHPLTNRWPGALPYQITGKPWLSFGYQADYLELPYQAQRALPLVFDTSSVGYEVNLADGKPRSLAAYFYDDSVYAQTVTVLDAVTGQVLDSRVVTNGFAGRYLVWNVEGHVRMRITNHSAHLQSRVNGLFADPFTNARPAVSLLFPTGTLRTNTPAKIILRAMASATDGVDRVEFHTATAKLGAAFFEPYEFLWEYPAAGSHEVFARAISSAGAVSDSDKAVVDVEFATPAQARFVGADAVTGGDWPGVYGLGGYWLPGTLNYKL